MYYGEGFFVIFQLKEMVEFFWCMWKAHYDVQFFIYIMQVTDGHYCFVIHLHCNYM
jgi:hypothetical protein